jgi:hypothetical protein
MREANKTCLRKEPEMYVSPSDAEQLCTRDLCRDVQKKQILHWAMLGFVSAVVSYALTGHLFFGVI